MATKDQYEFFARLYADEESRMAGLHERAKWYLSLATLYSGFILFVAEKLPPQSPWQWIAFYVAIGGMLACFLASLWGVRVTEYEAICDAAEAADALVSKGFDEGAFFDDRIADYQVAVSKNENVNAHKATALLVAGHLLLIGLAGHAAYFIVKLNAGDADVKRSAEATDRQGARRESIAANCVGRGRVCSEGNGTPGSSADGERASHPEHRPLAGEPGKATSRAPAEKVN